MEAMGGMAWIAIIVVGALAIEGYVRERQEITHQRMTRFDESHSFRIVYEIAREASLCAAVAWSPMSCPASAFAVHRREER